MLELACEETGLTKIEWSTPGLDLIRHEGRVRGVRTARGDIPAKLTVIATGSRSKLRDLHFGVPPTYEYPECTLNLLCDAIDGFRDSVYYALGAEGNMALIPLPDDEMRISIQFMAAEGRVSAQHAPTLVERRLEALPAAKIHIRSSHVYALSRSLALSFWIPGAVLLGDSAHATHPAGGQGMNMGFQDAEELASRLSDCDFSDSWLDRELEGYSRVRRSGSRAILRRTHLIGRMGCIRNSSVIALRERAIRLTRHRRFWKQRIFRKMVDVG